MNQNNFFCRHTGSGAGVGAGMGKSGVLGIVGQVSVVVFGIQGNVVRLLTVSSAGSSSSLVIWQQQQG